MDTTSASFPKPVNAHVACRSCHARKIKCSGDTPCTNCCQADKGADCTYPSRSRRIKVEQSYINKLHNEIRTLRSATHNQWSSREPNTTSPLSTAAERLGNASRALEPNCSNGTEPAPIMASEDMGRTVNNPLLAERPWFEALTPEMPLLVSEATDVAFATRARQELADKKQRHFQRVEHVQDKAIMSLWNSECPWPSPSRSRFLLKVAFNTVCQRYHILHMSSTRESLEQMIREPAACDTTSTCKLSALFALGELFSSRTCVSDAQFPGLDYYVSSTRMLQAISEHPNIHCVEVLTMLSIYSLAMNRRHSSYCYVGCAVRFAIITGLHLNVPPHCMPDPILRETRKRIWWTVYILDRSWASMLGKPVTIQDDDIDVDLPAELPPRTESDIDDFANTDYCIANLRIANLSAQISASIYRRRRQTGNFLSRVQHALQSLDAWLQELPNTLRAAVSQASVDSAAHIITLHLSFNQCIILASRPILLHTLRLRQTPDTRLIQGEGPPIDDIAISLSEACIQYARRSCRVLIDLWIRGSFPTFDSLYAQSLFSASIILALSSQQGRPDSHADGDDFESAVQVIEQLDQSGNFAAKEFTKHIAAIKTMLDGFGSQGQNTGSDPAIQSNRGQGSSAAPSLLTSESVSGFANDTVGPCLAEQSLEQLLSQSGWDCQFLESSFLDSEIEAFVWPEPSVIPMSPT